MADYSDPEDDFVRNIEEESLEYDVERQIDQTIAAYNQKRENPHDLRPQSSTKGQPAPKGRIESAKPSAISRKEPATRPAESAQLEGQKRGHYQTKKEMFYERFDEYVRQNHISPEDFWNPSKEKMNADEFKECLDIIGFSYQKDEFEDVIFDITDGNFDVVLPSLCSKISAWKDYTADRTLEALKDNVLKMAQESKKKLTSATSSKKGFMIRPQSGTLYSPTSNLNMQASRPFSGISVISSKSKKHPASAQTEYDKTELISTMKRSHYENKSAQYLKDAKKKQAQKEQVLSLTLNKAKGEQDYDCLAKMGEANELSQALGETITYRAYKSADGTLKCHIYDYDQLVAELTTKEFIREYKLLKQKYNQKNNFKIWEVLNQQKQTGANFYFSSAKTAGGKPGEEDYENERRGGVAKKDRQKELKTVLYETMKLTVTLKSQLDKLEKSGLVYENQLSKY